MEPDNSFQCEIDGPLAFVRKTYGDARGVLSEVYRAADIKSFGVDYDFVQDNYSSSTAHVLRGLHYQLRQPQAKLITVLRGAILDVGVDLRRNSPTFKRWFSFGLSAESGGVIYLPEGFAHGFYVIDGPADVFYKCSGYYDPADQFGVRWDDEVLGIDWRCEEPLLSEKDLSLPQINDISEDNLPLG